eukprot:3063654-Rhodomonas_salina.4
MLRGEGSGFRVQSWGSGVPGVTPHCSLSPSGIRKPPEATTTPDDSPRSQIQDPAISGQIVRGMRFPVFDFALYARSVPDTAPAQARAYAMSVPDTAIQGQGAWAMAVPDTA